MRFKLLAALLALLPMPALADTTAHYTIGDKPVTVEVEDGGNARLTIADKVTLIHRDGVDYVVVEDAMGNARVARAAELLTMMNAQMQSEHPAKPNAPKMNVLLTQSGSETRAGFAGTVWHVGPAPMEGAKTPPAVPGIDVVVSADPKLAPVGGFLKHVIGMAAPLMMQAIGDTDMVQQIDTLLAKGTPVRIGPFLVLASVETGEVPDARFALPATPMSATEFLEAVDPSKAAQALPPAP